MKICVAGIIAGMGVAAAAETDAAVAVEDIPGASGDSFNPK